ncbi:MAG TPA: hypothetical protein GXX29_01535 [Firmicutes bacterium]|nr:hypothetical protein [Bacillota bacterium]
MTFRKHNNEELAADPVEQFLADLAPKLPRKKRLDIMTELRSNLRDRVEELEKKGMSPETAARRAVAELGDPVSLAAEYGGGRIIIPSTRYHIFKALVITLVSLHLCASVMATIIDIDLTILFLRIPNLRGLQVYEVVTALATQALADVGILTVLFWWSQLTMPRSLPGRSALPRLVEAKPHWSGLIGPLVVLGIVNIWRNDVLALHMTSSNGWQAVPILADSFVKAYIWPVNLVMLLAIGVHTYKIISNPTAAVAGAEFIYRLAAFVLTCALLGARSPFDLPPGQLDALEPLFTGLFRLGLLATLFATAFAVYRAGARLVSRVR